MSYFCRRGLPIGLAMAVAMLALSGCSADPEPPEDQPTIYTVGRYSDGSREIPCYWTGTTRTDLAGDGTHYAIAEGIFVD